MYVCDLLCTRENLIHSFFSDLLKTLYVATPPLANVIKMQREQYRTLYYSFYPKCLHTLTRSVNMSSFCTNFDLSISLSAAAVQHILP